MDQTPISRGFRSKRQEQTSENRLPPGQYVTTDFPVLSAGPTPQIKLGDWTFALQLGGSLLGKWNWAEFEALPQTTIKRDIHCVTKWSKFDTTWQGVTFDDLLKAVGLTEPVAPYNVSMGHAADLSGISRLFVQTDMTHRDATAWLAGRHCGGWGKALL